MSACTEIYSNAQKCSDFAKEFRDVKLHLFPCLVERLSDCETLPGLDECLLRSDFRMELDFFFWSLLPRSCAPCGSLAQCSKTACSFLHFWRACRWS